MPIANPEVVARFRAALDDHYGPRIERVVLFGSRARGDAQPDSDYDVAVFLKDLGDRWAEIDRLVEMEAGILKMPVRSSTPCRSGPALIGSAPL